MFCLQISGSSVSGSAGGPLPVRPCLPVPPGNSTWDNGCKYLEQGCTQYSTWNLGAQYLEEGFTAPAVPDPPCPQVSPSKSRTKQLEALDNLVISTIYNVSSKLCASSSSVLRKTVAVLPEQEEEQVSAEEKQEQEKWEIGAKLKMFLQSI